MKSTTKPTRSLAKLWYTQLAEPTSALIERPQSDCCALVPGIFVLCASSRNLCAVRLFYLRHIVQPRPGSPPIKKRIYTAVHGPGVDDEVSTCYHRSRLSITASPRLGRTSNAAGLHSLSNTSCDPITGYIPHTARPSMAHDRICFATNANAQTPANVNGRRLSPALMDTAAGSSPKTSLSVDRRVVELVMISLSLIVRQEWLYTCLLSNILGT